MCNDEHVRNFDLKDVMLYFLWFGPFAEDEPMSACAHFFWTVLVAVNKFILKCVEYPTA
jgi:hypothetical protein